jgi:hypothetical protein
VVISSFGREERIMIRILLGSLLSAVVLFVFGMASWMFLGLHEGTIRPLPDQSAVKDLLARLELQNGASATRRNWKFRPMRLPRSSNEDSRSGAASIGRDRSFRSFTRRKEANRSRPKRWPAALASTLPAR